MTRSGTSLVELVVALTLFGVVAGAMVLTLNRQARFHDGITRILEASTQLSGAHDVLARELRGVSTAAGDVKTLSDSSVVYRTLVGTAVACAVADTIVTLVPESLASGERLATFASAPQAGDTAWLLDEGPRLDETDDRWMPATVMGSSRLTGVCTGSAFVDPGADATAPAWRLTISPGAPLGAAIAAGAAVRVTRWARFALYRASTGETVLGWAEWNVGAGAWNTIQPVSGPFLAFNRSRPTASGLALEGWDSGGAALAFGTLAPSMSRLSVTVRAVTRGAVRMDGLPRGPRVDSLQTTIGLRNWR
jgi:hypothetical protein